MMENQETVADLEIWQVIRAEKKFPISKKKLLFLFKNYLEETQDILSDDEREEFEKAQTVVKESNDAFIKSETLRISTFYKGLASDF